MNYHTLADFRTDHGDLLDQLLTQGVAVLMHEELVTLQRVAQDGVRVRASAGAASFRRRVTLEDCLHQAEEQVRCLKEELQADPGATTRRQQQARRRATEERCARVRQALATLPELEAKQKIQDQKAAQGQKVDRHSIDGPQAQGKKANRRKKEPRVSTTDPEARVMKMADGGFRPAYNIQLATDTGSQVITGVDVSNAGNDQGQMAPMAQQHEQRYGTAPGAMLVDGGFVKVEDIEAVSASEVETTVYAPVPQPRDESRDPHVPLPGDSEAVGAWRQRMGTAEAKEIYKERAATSECVNALARQRGLYQLGVRGLAKVKAVVLWYALAHNLLRSLALRAGVTVKGLAGRKDGK